MLKPLRIGTRESQLAVWQARLVQQLLIQYNLQSELVFIKSEGDIDVQTPIYDMGVTGVFTRSLDIALLTNKIDIAVHSMKDVPTQLATGIVQAAVLERASYKDILVYKEDAEVGNGQLSMGNNDTSINNSLHIQHSPFTIDGHSQFTVATSSIRRRAQWLHRYPDHTIENLRGNVNTRLRKLKESNWNGAIFAAAGLERINLRPASSIDLDWMLPAPAQGAIMVVCREEDHFSMDACRHFNHDETSLCTGIERAFLKTLLGGCSAPISALAEIKDKLIVFKGSVLSVDGKEKAMIERTISRDESKSFGVEMAHEILSNGAKTIIGEIRNGAN